MAALFQDLGLLILRVFSSAFMLTHGWGKLSTFAEKMNEFPDPIGLGSPIALTLAVGAEFGCSLLIILGVATRLTAIPLVITMLVAGGIIHAADPFQKKELALLYAVIYVAIFFLGSGRFALGRKLFKNKWLH